MRKLIGIVLSAGAACGSSGALPADLDVPTPPLPSVRSLVDWQGGYAGVSAALEEFEAAIGTYALPVNVNDGDGNLAGIILGYAWREGRWLAAVEADLGFGFSDLAGQEEEKALLATVRPRIGYDAGRIVPYLTLGVAFAGLSADGSPSDYDELDYAIGGLAGAGLEMPIARHLSGRIEYVYGRFWDAELGEDVNLHLDNFHILRAGLVYHWE